VGQDHLRTALSTDARRAFLTAMEKSHGRRLHRFLSHRLSRGRAEVPDLVQEVFLRLLRVENHEAIRNPQAYLYTIANHVLHQHTLRTAAALEVTRFADIVGSLHPSDEVDPEAELEMEQRFEAIGKALEAHSARAYTTLILHRCDGIPLKEIAPRLGVSYTMAKRYLAQGLAFCQRMLDEMESRT
jgi:RNA polymerase sigma factor (sigma-70 family)